MDLKPLQRKLTLFLKKYRYVILVVAIGLILMAIPESRTDISTKNEETSVEIQAETTIDEQLARVLSHVSGAGKVQVLLTTVEGEETVYQTNEDISMGDGSESSQTDTVILTDAARNQKGLVRQINPPMYRGAIVVCEGADDPTVQLAIVDAVSKVTGLGANRISVLKMK